MVRFDQLELAEVEGQPYWDVPAAHWAAKYIQSAKEAGLLSFVENNRLRPNEAMIRSESVEMLGKTSLADGKIKDLYSWQKGFKPEVDKRPTIKAGTAEFAFKQ